MELFHLFLTTKGTKNPQGHKDLFYFFLLFNYFFFAAWRLCERNYLTRSNNLTYVVNL